MLEFSEWKGAIYGVSGTKNCTKVLHHNYTYTESSPTTPPCGDCAVGRKISHCSLPPQCGAEKVRARKGREQDYEQGVGGKEQPHKCISFKRRPKHTEVKLNSQTKGERTALSPLPDCNSFPHLLSFTVKVKKPSLFHISSRTSFTVCIATFFLVNRDSGLKASEARYDFVTL